MINQIQHIKNLIIAKALFDSLDLSIINIDSYICYNILHSIEIPEQNQVLSRRCLLAMKSF